MEENRLFFRTILFTTRFTSDERIELSSSTCNKLNSMLDKNSLGILKLDPFATCSSQFQPSAEITVVENNALAMGRRSREKRKTLCASPVQHKAKY